MIMDLGQLTQMATWLDEEHRRDKAELIRLQQQFEHQDAEQQDQSRTLKDLEGRLAGIQGQLLRFSQLETALQQLKDEVVQMLAQSDDRRQQEGREQERVRAIERDNVSRALNEIRRELQRLPHFEEEIELRKAEQRRVSESLLNAQQELTTMGKEVENKLRLIPFLEDNRQQDSKRIARLQQETLEALKRSEQHGSRLQMIEDVMQRQERDTAELKELVAQLRKSQREFIEAQLLQMDQLKHQLAEWVETLEPQLKRIDDFAVKQQVFSEAFRQDRSVIEGVQRFQDQIKREQTQVSELQRLGEERQKRQLEQSLEENEKRWRKELLRWDHQMAEQSQHNKQVADQFRGIEARVAQHQTEIAATWKFLESQIAYQTQESRRWLGEMTRLLEERPKKE